MVKLTQGGNFLKADAVKEGDTVTFKDEGRWVESTKYTYPDGNPKKDFVIAVDYKGTDFSIRLNKFSREELVKGLGDDTAKWVGKEAKINIETYRSLNTKGIILSPAGDVEWEADE